MTQWDEVLDFWFDATPADKRFARDEALDAEIARRFCDLHATLAVDGVPDDWRASARGMLAAVVVLDQFSRNIFRDDARAFEFDRAARALAMEAIEQGLDTRITEIERQFLYMPLMHSERVADVERFIALTADFDDTDAVEFARRHADVIRRFGRYPARNAAVGRESSADELAFLEATPEGF